MTSALIWVNRQPAAADQVLQPGDRISLTPTKIGDVHSLMSDLSRIMNHSTPG